MNCSKCLSQLEQWEYVERWLEALKVYKLRYGETREPKDVRINCCKCGRELPITSTYNELVAHTSECATKED